MGDLSEKISVSTASLGLVLVITYTRKVMCFMLSFQVFAFIMQHPERWAGWTRVKREREQNDSIHLLVNKVVVNLGYESPSRDLWWSPGLRQGGCGSLPRVTLREPRGRSWSFLVQLPWQALNRQGGKTAPHSNVGSPQCPRVCQKVVPGEHKGQGGPSHPSSPQEAQQQKPESFCAPCTAVSICMLSFPSTMRSRPITNVWSSGSRESWSSRSSLSLRLVCKQANCKRLTYYRVPCPRESLFFVPF